MLVNVELDTYISEYNRITFQGCGLHGTSSFLIVQELNEVGNPREFSFKDRVDIGSSINSFCYVDN